MTGEVLSPAEVASYSNEYSGLKWLCNSHEVLRTRLTGTEASLKHAEAEAEGLKTRAELAEAEITRLRGLIEGMECEAKCAIYEAHGELCRKCGVAWAYVHFGTCKDEGFHEIANIPQKPCNCVKSQVNL